MDPLRFGPLSDPRSRWIAEGVVSGVSGYGNSVGVPTVGGETVFDETYQDNPLVNVFCLGLLPRDRLVLARASGVGNLTVLFGSSTGRDGIGGASVLASAGFGEEADDADKRPSVQVGDPFEEKRLIEACLEMLDAGLVVGIQDLGAAGITGASSETSSKGGVGMDVHLSGVHVREQGMEPFEIMTSESQERMLAIVEPDKLDDVLAICRRWEVMASVIGTVTGSGRLRVLDRTGGEVLADIPAVVPRRGRPALRAAPRTARGPRGPPGRPQRAARAGRPGRGPARPAGRHVVGVEPVRPPALPEHRRGPRRGRHRAAAQAPAHGRRHRPWAGPHLRRQPPLVRARSPPRHRPRRGRGRAQPRLRRCPPARARELPQLRQPRAPRGHVAAVSRGGRHGRGLPRPRPPGRGWQREPLQREPRAGHRPEPRGRRARPRRPPRAASARGAAGRRRHHRGARA